MHWRGNMQADYFYANGFAGNKFFLHLKEKDSFLASTCPECTKTFVPPRLYCEDCFCEIPDENWKELAPEGTIRLFTIATIDSHGEPLTEPRIMAMIDIHGADSSMLGVVKAELDEDLCGKKVKAVLKPVAERDGTLKDILYYE